MGIETTKTNACLLEYRLTMGMTVMEGQGFYYPVDTTIAADGRMYVISRSRDEVARGVRVTMCNVDGEYFGNFGGVFIQKYYHCGGNSPPQAGNF
jgi:hypothetical protein